MVSQVKGQLSGVTSYSLRKALSVWSLIYVLMYTKSVSDFDTEKMNLSLLDSSFDLGGS